MRSPQGERIRRLPWEQASVKVPPGLVKGVKLLAERKMSGR